MDRATAAALLLSILTAHARLDSFESPQDAQDLLRRHLHRMSASLSPRERRVIVGHCIEERRLAAIADEEGTSRPFMSQLHKRALRKLSSRLLTEIRSSPLRSA